MARIVIVDDDDLVTEIATEALAANGHMVSAVHDGDEASEAILRGQPDLVILDYSLPEKTGMELLREIRATQQAADMPVMMLTARGGAIHIGRAMQEGADDYIVKPFDIAEMVRRVEALLVGSRLARSVSAALAGPP